MSSVNLIWPHIMSIVIKCIFKIPLTTHAAKGEVVLVMLGFCYQDPCNCDPQNEEGIKQRKIVWLNITKICT